MRRIDLRPKPVRRVHIFSAVTFLVFAGALVYTLYSLTGEALITWRIFFFLLLTLIAGSGISFVAAWKEPEERSIRRKLSLLLWASVVLWFWGIAPLYTYFTLSLDGIQLNWTAFIFIWEVPIIGGLFVLYGLRMFEPAAHFLHATKKQHDSIAASEIDRRLVRYPALIALTQAVWSIVGFSLGTLQYRLFAGLPPIEQLKNMMNGFIMSLFFGLILFFVLDAYVSKLRTELKHTQDIPFRQYRHISRRIVGLTFAASLGLITLIGQLTLTSWQGLIQAQILIRMREQATAAVLDLSRVAPDDNAAREAVLQNLMRDFQQGNRGIAITLPEENPVLENIPLDPRVRDQVFSGPTSIHLDNQGEAKIVTVIEDSFAKQRLVSVVYLSEFYWTLGEPMLFFLMGSLIVAAVIVGLTVLLSLAVTRSFRRLIESVQSGNSMRIADFSSGDEIETLANALKQSVQKAAELQENLEQRVVEQTQQIRKAANELEKKNKELEEAYVKDEALLSSIGEGVAAVDKSGRFVFVNGVLAETLEISTSDILNKTLFDPTIPFPAIEYENGEPMMRTDWPLARVLVTGTRTSSLVYQVTKNGRRTCLQITAAPIILHGELSGAIAVLRDVTEEKRVEHAKSEFVSIASHQFRTPLSILSWYTEVLLSNDLGPLAEKQRKFIAEIHRATRRLTALVNTILQITRIELGSFPITGTHVRLDALIDDALKEHARHIAEKKLRVQKQYGADIPSLSYNADILSIVCNNIISNAVRYTPDAGTIRIEAGADKDAGVYFLVQDTGYGIPPDEQGAVFTRLFRATNINGKSPDGTGIGLYITKLILDRIGGSIRFESNVDAGTTFFVHIPIRAPVHTLSSPRKPNAPF